ncbi:MULTISPECIES: hypothetical protein [Herbaspirillum]|jgi:hypothetical protein|uniref:Uncharacterized protein n=2 Tax=Herbaspirillum huttiense TaxID=863372 RepID=A0AAJ2H4X7_9BURK|nr:MULTISPECIES: hypothetical protein [Herbaspirillum]MDR9836814.1 hypothetical protein [Herbaspirillum huttiense]
MQASIKIDMGNAAFENSPSSEVARILRELADKVEDRGVSIGDGIKLYDVNGNNVGQFEVTK